MRQHNAVENNDFGRNFHLRACKQAKHRNNERNCTHAVQETDCCSFHGNLRRRAPSEFSMESQRSHKRHALTDDSDTRIELTIFIKDGRCVQLGKGFVGVGIHGSAFNTCPLPYHAVPGQHRIQDAGMSTNNGSLLKKHDTYKSLHYAYLYIV